MEEPRDPAPDPALDTTPASPAPIPPPAPAAVDTSAKVDLAKRFVAKFLDGLVAYALFWLVNWVVPGWTLGFFLGGLAAAGYWLVSDGLALDFMKHRSLGKHIMKITLTRSDGRPMDIEASVKRNWMFTIGYFYSAFAYGLGFALASIVSLAALGIFVYEIYKVYSDPMGRRWGDELAGTTVVNAEA